MKKPAPFKVSIYRDGEPLPPFMNPEVKARGEEAWQAWLNRLPQHLLTRLLMLHDTPIFEKVKGVILAVITGKDAFSPMIGEQAILWVDGVVPGLYIDALDWSFQDGQEWVHSLVWIDTTGANRK